MGAAKRKRKGMDERRVAGPEANHTPFTIPLNFFLSLSLSSTSLLFRLNSYPKKCVRMSGKRILQNPRVKHGVFALLQLKNKDINNNTSHTSQ